MQETLIRAGGSVVPIRQTANAVRTDLKRTLVCFSHLRWSFVLQRPQHLMARFARDHDVVFWEEPTFGEPGDDPYLKVGATSTPGVTVVTPKLPESLDEDGRTRALRQLLDEFLSGRGDLVLWYYTPMMLAFSRHLRAARIVYDCMDELSQFCFAPTELPRLEQELFERADVVFTGGYSLFEAKRALHPNVHCLPSSVDTSHFAAARTMIGDPHDQRELPRPRLGYYGVIDERLDLGLIAATARAHPEWSIVMIGPTVKIDPADLPRDENITYLGMKPYDSLPAYLAGWDVALMPFAVNASTRYISPTKTPEYLAGGRPVVSTAIADVARSYGQLAAVTVAASHAEFIAGCERALRLGTSWQSEADAVLAGLSWDRTYERMSRHVAPSVRTPTSAVARSPSLPAGKAACDYLIVGAGFAGAVLAERLAEGLGKRVLVIDRRPHIGGNAFDEKDAAGILIHRYGPHIFHTNSPEIFDYLSRFTNWRPYEHRVLANVDERLVPIPINRTALNDLYGLSLTNEREAEAFLAARAEPRDEIRTAADVVISQVGQDLYQKFFRGYTRKQWGLDPSQLDRSVTARIPTRTNTDDRYFTDRFQAMPARGYTALFEKMLDHPRIKIMTGVEFAEIRHLVNYDQLIYTGPIDEYFGFRFGNLPYRSLSFQHQTLDREWFQPVATVNFPAEWTPYTRITEFKHLTGQTHPRTSIVYEHPAASGDPYYPVPRPENLALFKLYEALAMKTSGVEFVGRLATYRYYNMDQVVGQALAAYRRLARREAAEGRPLAAVSAPA